MTAERATGRVRRRFAVQMSFLERFQSADPGLMAAAVAFNVFFALVPTMFALFTALSFVGADAGAKEAVEEVLQALVPADLVAFIIDIIEAVSDTVAGQEGAIIFVSLAIALWSGSRGVHTVQKALARIERHEEDRPAWRVRLIGIGLTIGAGFALVLVSLLVLWGKAFVAFLSELTGIEVLDAIRIGLGIPVAGIGVYLLFYGVYRWGPPEPISGAGIVSDSTLGQAF